MSAYPVHLPKFRVTDARPENLIINEQPWATLCPVHLSRGDAVWLLLWDAKWDSESKGWRLVESARHPCVITKLPPTRTGLYELRLLNDRTVTLAPGWVLDYVAPYEEIQQ